MESNKYKICINRNTGLYGIRPCDENGIIKKEWWIRPIYEAIGSIGGSFGTWFKKGGKYGFLDILNKEEKIPAEYGFPLYFSEQGYAEAWKNCKAGIINLHDEIVIPIEYDEIRERVLRNGSHPYGNTFKGYVCYKNDGTSSYFDENLEADEMKDWEKPGEPYIMDSENRLLTVLQLEDKIKENFRKLIEMGYNCPSAVDIHSEKHKEEIWRIKELVQDALYERRRKMNVSWIHTKENVDRIERVNNLLMKAVKKAIRLGKKTTESLQWIKKISNQEHYDVAVYVYPLWKNDSSEYGYVPVEPDRIAEQSRLCEQQDNESSLHIWNIIARMGDVVNDAGITCCFSKFSSEYDPQDWNYRKCVMDDGQSWDERIHFPAYQNVYFLHPFHNLYCDMYEYSLEDIASINDFRVEVKVILKTREQDNR